MESINSSVARSNGLCGATHPAKAAQKMQIAATAAEPIATGDDLNECQTSPPKKRERANGEAGKLEAPNAVRAPVSACQPVRMRLPSTSM